MWEEGQLRCGKNSTFFTTKSTDLRRWWLCPRPTTTGRWTTCTRESLLNKFPRSVHLSCVVMRPKASNLARPLGCVNCAVALPRCHVKKALMTCHMMRQATQRSGESIPGESQHRVAMAAKQLYGLYIRETSVLGTCVGGTKSCGRQCKLHGPRQAHGSTCWLHCAEGDISIKDMQPSMVGSSRAKVFIVKSSTNLHFSLCSTSWHDAVTGMWTCASSLRWRSAAWVSHRANGSERTTLLQAQLEITLSERHGSQSLASLTSDYRPQPEQRA